MDVENTQDKMAAVVFNKENLGQLKDALIAMMDVLGDVLEMPFEPGTRFCHDDVIHRLEAVSQEKWRFIRKIFLEDPFFGTCTDDLKDEENSPAKVMLDFVRACDQIGTELHSKLLHYQEVIKTLYQEKADLELSLSKMGHQLMNERSLTSQEKMELKTARGSVIFWEGLVQSKNQTIAELQRQQNVQLWEREKERLFAETENKIKVLEKELDNQKKINENLTRRVAQTDESNKMLRMKQDLAMGTLPLANVKSSEDLRRSIYLLEKDVIFLEQQLYTQQRTFATVLCGLKTDLLIFSDHVTNAESMQTKYKEFVRLCEITSAIFKAMLQGDLIETVKTLPPHYSYLPSETKSASVKLLCRTTLKKCTCAFSTVSTCPGSAPCGGYTSPSHSPHVKGNKEFKVKRVKRVSRSQLTPLQNLPKREPESATTAVDVTQGTKQQAPGMQEESVVENPRLVDPVSKIINSTRCMQYFPHMSQDSVKEHWAKFQEFDVDGNDSLDFTEVVKALTSLGLQFTAQQAEEAMLEADVNKNRTLDFYEYLIVSDKLFSKKGHSELFHTGAAKENRRVMAKTCVLQ